MYSKQIFKFKDILQNYYVLHLTIVLSIAKKIKLKYTQKKAFNHILYIMSNGTKTIRFVTIYSDKTV